MVCKRKSNFGTARRYRRGIDEKVLVRGCFRWKVVLSLPCTSFEELTREVRLPLQLARSAFRAFPLLLDSAEIPLTWLLRKATLTIADPPYLQEKCSSRLAGFMWEISLQRLPTYCPCLKFALAMIA